MALFPAGDHKSTLNYGSQIIPRSSRDLDSINQISVAQMSLAFIFQDESFWILARDTKIPHKPNLSSD